MIAMPTFYFEFEEDDQRRDVSVCNYGLKLSTGNNAYQMNTFAGMGVGKYRINWKRSEVLLIVNVISIGLYCATLMSC